MSSAGEVLDRNVIESLRALGDGDDAFLAELISTYLEETPHLLMRLREAVAADDAGGVRLNAHSLKGSSAEFGASYLTELCRQLELAGKNQDLLSARDLMAEVEEEYPRVESALSRLIQSQG
jgi:HPt (histidine-containing phosphotransfer) domain-containing protein